MIQHLAEALAHYRQAANDERQSSLDTSEHEAAVSYEEWRANPSKAYKPAHGGYPAPSKEPAP